ncbi:MurR/RpiR family transcriptional regulator [Alicyclobacillus fastidiosus]|uniref:MurR/RpiR family transcriptional regulator n=1 Tax=Alicyclobacillus fastidiosus TaxID=392011 RepID=A0ABY6ZF79_9BACL|nr:MurR/RpiR family transcriptional regulator [Alicyclobacillus fastidiosus]WAH41507.1 MurR/RpiR family transcriptional regulator [Alicyclobacillus fastidiosus]GMA63156.1 putative HTH-type transcriptional regulator [Alicyclobacillus fastidiosus]
MKRDIEKTQTTANSLAMIYSILPSLSNAEQKVAQAVLDNPSNTVYSSVTDLAEAAEVGETTVIRFCRKLGYRGFQEFKMAIAQDLVSPSQQVYGKIEEDDSIDVVCRKMTMFNRQTLDDTLSLLQESELQKATDALIAGKRHFFFGVGSSGITAADAQYRFMRLGFDSHAASDGHIIAMNCAMTTESDVILGISTSGSTKDLVDALRIAKENGAYVICLTGHARSPITSYANAILLAASKETPLQGGAFASKLAQIHVLDILSTIVSLKQRTSTFEALNKSAKSVLDKMY